jgi:putative ABC transport system substrate-binding protein
LLNFRFSSTESFIIDETLPAYRSAAATRRLQQSDLLDSSRDCVTARDKSIATPAVRVSNPKWLQFVALSFLLALYAAAASAQTKLPKIGWLSAVSGRNRGQDAIVGRLRELGYIEGKTIVYEFRYADTKLDRLSALANELVHHKVDLLISPGTPGSLALKKATKTIPIVFTDVTDPVAAGLVDSLAHPGGNITGCSSVESLLAGKRLEILKETVANLTQVAVLWDPRNPSSKLEWQDSQVAARELGLQLYSLEVSSADRYESALREASTSRSGALSVLSSPLAAAQQEQIVRLAMKYRLPAIYVQENFSTIGGLMSYGPNQSERYKRIAVFIDKILKGAKPANLPVERPTKFEFIVHLKSAKQIGLTIPPNVLVRADKVIR